MKTKIQQAVTATVPFEQLSTWNVLWRVYKRHELFLLYLCLVCILTAWLVTA